MIQRSWVALVLGLVGCGSGSSSGSFDIATQMVADAFFYSPVDHPPTDYSQLALIYDPAQGAVLASLVNGNLALRGFSGPLTGPTTFDVSEARYADREPASGSGEVSRNGASVTVSFALTAVPTDPPWTFTGTLDHVGPLSG